MLDQQGAEQLLGQGDMLYLKPGLGAPMRIHGAFVEDDEVHRIVAKWKEYGEPEYIENILETSEDNADGSSESSDGSSEDPLYNEAVEIVLKTQKASISAVQRKLKIGYNRSARLMEEMEENGIISEMNQNGMRDVLIIREPQ
jgi:S-DNA-T family DNA segregation ATPase FtsK/SpoIIIE